MIYFPGFILLTGIFYYYFDDTKIYSNLRSKKQKNNKLIQTDDPYNSEIGMEDIVEGNHLDDSIEMLIIH